MGSFPGHFLPGAFFICFAVWWTTQLAKRRSLCDLKRVPFYSTATWPCLYGRILSCPTEGIIKMIATSLGMAGELFAAFDYGQSRTIVSIGDIQHVTMYGFFFISGLCDVLQAKWNHMTPGVDYMASAAAFSAEYILFSFHLNGREMLDIQIHNLLLSTIAICVIFILLEYNYPHSVLICAGRIYFVFLQGTWFIQVGFILYNPIPGHGSWAQDDDHVILAAALFTWHAVGVLFTMTAIVVITDIIRRRTCPVTSHSDEYRMIGNHSYRFIIDDEQSDLSEDEFDIRDYDTTEYKGGEHLISQTDAV